MSLMLCVVAFRNLVELSGSTFDLTDGFVLPKSFGWFRGNNILWTISYVSWIFVTFYLISDLVPFLAGSDRHGIRSAR